MDLKLSQILESSILVEGRLEKVKEKYDPINHVKIDWLSERDPSGNNKYLEWLAKQLLYTPAEEGGSWSWYRGEWKVRNGDDRQELIRDLEYFHSNPSKYEKRDINQYKTLDEFTSATEIAKTKLSRKQIKEQGANKVYEDDNFALIHPLTHEASCKYGSRTRWCVTMRGYTNYFERYSTNGPLFFLIDKRRMEPSDSPKWMQQSPDYYKVAIHLQPIFEYYSLSDKDQAYKYASKMSKEDFVNSVNRGKIDYWNVSDKKVSESLVMKFLGGPGRGQKERANEILSTLKNVMTEYTKKILSDYWEKVNSEENTETQTKVKELESKFTDLQNKRNNIESILNNLRSAFYYLEDLLNADYYDHRKPSEELVNRINSMKEEYGKMGDELSEIKEEQHRVAAELDEIKGKSNFEFSFYDIQKSKPV